MHTAAAAAAAVEAVAAAAAAAAASHCQPRCFLARPALATTQINTSILIYYQAY